MLYFPVDQQSLDYLRLTGRPEKLIELVKAYFKAQGLFRTGAEPEPEFSQIMELDLSQVQPSLSGPKRPQDRVALSEVKESFRKSLLAPRNQNGFGLSEEDLAKSAEIRLNGRAAHLEHGSVVIAAITSCTNTSNPFVMISAGLLAQKAVEKGLKTKPYVKTSLAPGSRVVTDYLREACLLEPLEQLGFNLVAYGCTTCIGNSGPLDEPIAEAIRDNNLVAVAVLSGNRNFEGRIHPLSRANYLTSPPLVVAYALAGSMDIDLSSEPLGADRNGQPVYLRDIWPSTQDVQRLIQQVVRPRLFRDGYESIYSMNADWNLLESKDSLLYQWEEDSTYLQKPPFFEPRWEKDSDSLDILNARVLAYLGDSITTDHISPAGSIPVDSPAGQYLLSRGVPPSEFNSYGSRRGNDRVMARGTLANIRLKNLLVPGVEGGYTLHIPSGECMTIFNAAMRYLAENTPLIILAGKEYGSGSSRDWAAKAVLLLGVQAVIAESFERIHRSNLAEMGVLPLQFLPGENAAVLDLHGTETFSIMDLKYRLNPGDLVEVEATAADGKVTRFNTIVRLDTTNEVYYYLHGGIMNAILAKYLPSILKD
jgi:aconitate hydratase